MTDAQAAARAVELAQLVEGGLVRVLPTEDSYGLDEFGAQRLLGSMRYSLSTPGKRIRPLLLLASAEVSGADPEPFIDLACALEMIHAYSLIHDDLPDMDDDELRRGLPTNHMVFGPGMAILAGDGLLTEALGILLRPVIAADVQMEVAAEVAAAAGFRGMVGGQAADLLAESETDRDETMLRSIHRRKTGALISVAVVAGARLAGASSDVTAALTGFGGRFGLAFQIADDIKDVVAPETVSGKYPGGDLEAGKLTYPQLFGLDGSRVRCLEELEGALEALAPLAATGELLVSIARDAVAPALAAQGD